MWPSFDDQPSVSPSSFVHPVASFESKNYDHCQVDCSEDEYIMQSSPQQPISPHPIEPQPSPQLSPNQPLNPSSDPKGTSQRRYPEIVRQSKVLFPIEKYVSYSVFSAPHSAFLSSISSISEPKSYRGRN